jgi:hypothetical protein
MGKPNTFSCGGVCLIPTAVMEEGCVEYLQLWVCLNQEFCWDVPHGYKKALGVPKTYSCDGVCRIPIVVEGCA